MSDEPGIQNSVRGWIPGLRASRASRNDGAKKPRIGAAFAFSNRATADQRVTTTVVPTETRW
jgi:hypothetical protein